MKESFFQDKYIELFSEIASAIEKVDSILEVESPLLATTIIRTESEGNQQGENSGIIDVLSYKEALEEGFISDLADYKERFSQSDYHGTLLSKDYTKVATVLKVKFIMHEPEYNLAQRALAIQETQRIIQEKTAELGIHIPQNQWYFSGDVSLQHFLTKYTRMEFFILLSIVFALILIFLYFIFRKILPTLLLLYTAFTVCNLTISLFVFNDYPISPIGLTLPILILVIVIADVFHILKRWEVLSIQVKDRSRVLSLTLKQTWFPCFLTSLTTSVGFASFYFTEIVPLKQFSELSMIAILLAYLAMMLHSFFFLGAFGKLFLSKYAKAANQTSGEKKVFDLPKEAVSAGHPYLHGFLTWAHAFSEKYYKAIASAVVILITLGIFSLQFARTETNFLDVFFKKSSPIYQDFLFIDEHLSGTGSIDILLFPKAITGQDKQSKENESTKSEESTETTFIEEEQGSDTVFSDSAPGETEEAEESVETTFIEEEQGSDAVFSDSALGETEEAEESPVQETQESKSFNEIEIFQSLKGFEKDILPYELINTVQSYINPVRMMHQDGYNQKTEVPESTAALNQELFTLELSRSEKKNDVLSPYLNFDYSKARIHIQTPNLNSNASRIVQQNIHENIQLPEGYDYLLTGLSVYFQVLGDYVLDTQLLSAAITLLFVFIIFYYCFRLKLAVLGFIVNFLPLLLTIASVILLNIPFDFATILIFSVSFGLCVDDAIHFLHYYHKKEASNKARTFQNFQIHVKETLLIVGQPIFFTSLLFGLAFIVFAYANLVLLIKFGLFTLISLALALASNTIILPALLFCFDKPRKKAAPINDA